MKKLITVLLSVALLLILPGTPVNNSEPQATHTKLTGQRESILTGKDVAQVETPKASLAVVQPVIEVTQVASTPPIQDSHEQLMSLAGIQPEDYGAADYIVSHESSWNRSATEPHTGAYGLCQSLPAVKMASAGSDWQTNPVTQLKWCNSYALTRYGGWQQAYAHWAEYRWW